MPTIADQLTQLEQDREDFIDNLETQGIDDLTGDETFTELVPRVLDIETGGGGGGGAEAEEKDVNFYDYDGTLVNSYTASEFLQLSAMPSNPSHQGLVAQGWNWTLSDAQDYVEEYGVLDVGQTYTTASGLSEFDIELTPATGLSVTLKMDGTKNWGDNSSDTSTTHTYQDYGKYTITCDGDTMTSSSDDGFFGQSINSINYHVKNARVVNVTNIPNYCFSYCYNLKTVILPIVSSTYNTYLFSNTYQLNYITIPIEAGIGGSVFINCYGLKKISLGKRSIMEHSSVFQSCNSLQRVIMSTEGPSVASASSVFSGCNSLETVIISSNSSRISTSFFSNCYLIKLYDFSRYTAVPSLQNVNAFRGINGLAKIIVPDNLYNDWISTTNWSTYADYIYKASEV